MAIPLFTTVPSQTSLASSKKNTSLNYSIQLLSIIPYMQIM